MVATAFLSIVVLTSFATLARDNLWAAIILGVVLLVVVLAYLLWWLRRQESHLLAKAEPGTVFASRSYIHALDLFAHARFGGALEVLRNPKWFGVSGQLEIGPHGIRFRPNPKAASGVIEIPWAAIERVDLTRNPLKWLSARLRLVLHDGSELTLLTTGVSRLRSALSNLSLPSGTAHLFPWMQSH